MDSRELHPVETNSHSHPHQSFLHYKSLYFLVFAGLGVLFPFIPVYYESLLFTKSQIGLLCMMPNFCSFLVAPIFSIVGDMLHAHYELMIISLISSTLSSLAILAVRTFLILAFIVLIGSIMRAPLTPQIDALVISTLPEKTRYGELRLWGAVSFGIFSLVGGILTSSSPEEGVSKPSNFRWIFYLHSFFFFSAGFILLYLVNKIQLDNLTASLRRQGVLPRSHSDSEKPEDENNGNKVESLEKRPVLVALKQVFCDHPEVGIFSLVVFLSGFGSGVIDSFLFLRLKQLGGSGYVMGISRFITCAAEVPLFQISGYLQSRFGVWPVIAVTQLAFVIRFSYYSWLTNPWYVLPCEVLHGFTFAVMWSVSCSYANMISPPECHSSMQALLEGLHWGFGSGMGALIGGFAYDNWGAVKLFEASAVLSFGSLLLATSVSYYKHREEGMDLSRHPQAKDYSMVQEQELSKRPLTSRMVTEDSDI